MYGANFGSLISFRFIDGGCLTKGLHDSDLNVLVFLCCTCVAPTQFELSDSEVISFLLFVYLGHVSMKLNHKYTFKPYIKRLFFCTHLLQTENGESLPEDESSSEYFLSDSSSEFEDEREQVGYRRKVNRAIVLPVVFLKSISVYLFQ